jgi:hypothetical protein
LRPQRGSSPARPASTAIARAAASAVASSATPRQWIAWIGPLSSIRSPASSSRAASTVAMNSAASPSRPASDGSGLISSSPDRVEADQRPHVGGAPPRYRADQCVALGQPDQQLARLVRQCRVLGVLDDRHQGAVEVGQDRRPCGLGAERLEQHLPGRPGGLGIARHGA